MLADGVEASVRSLDEKDEESIREMVNRIVDARVEDGQLDDAELTLRDIAQIKDAFVAAAAGHVPPPDQVPRQRRPDGVSTGSRPDAPTLEPSPSGRLGWGPHGLHGHLPRPDRSGPHERRRSSRWGSDAALALIESAVCETVQVAVGGLRVARSS